jgi:DNA mismatch repair ATPase MutS
VAVLTESSSRVGLFIVYKVTKSASFCSFEDNAEFDSLDAILESLAPAECYLPEMLKDLAKVSKILQQQNISIVKAPFKATHNLESAMKELEKVVDLSTVDRGRLEKDERLSLLAAGLLVPTLTNLKLEIVPYDFSLFMKVSSSTLEGLHIFGKSSLFSTLNHTRTGGGERLLKSWLR